MNCEDLHTNGRRKISRKISRSQNSIDELLLKKLQENGREQNGNKPENLNEEKEEKSIEQMVGACIPCAREFSDPFELLSHIEKHVPDILKLCNLNSKPLDLTPFKQTLNEFTPHAMFLPQENEAAFSPLEMRYSSSDKLSYFMCPMCCSTFRSASAYKTHLQIHSLESKPSTSIGGVFAESESQFKCSQCPSRFLDVNKYRDHLKDLHGLSLDAGIDCPYCGLSFPSEFECNRHQGSHTGATHQCSACGKCFTQKRSLVVHAKECKEDSVPATATPKSQIDVESLICSECGDAFQDAEEFRAHKLTHEEHNNEEALPVGEYSDTEESEPNNLSPGCYPKYKPVTHALDNDYLNHILKGITKRSPAKRVHRKRKKREETEAPASPAESSGSKSQEGSLTLASSFAGSPPPDAGPLNLKIQEKSPGDLDLDIEGPLHNDYFKTLVQSNVRKYSRQRLRDPVDNYMYPKLNL